MDTLRCRDKLSHPAVKLSQPPGGPPGQTRGRQRQQRGERHLEFEARPKCIALSTTPTPGPDLFVAVQIERQYQPNAWEDWRFRILDVQPDEGQFGDSPRLLRDDGRSALFLHPRLPVSLHRDEAEGYYLNLSSGAPVWFVMWRREEPASPAAGVPPSATPLFVTLSYHEAGRLLDAQEQVDNVPLPETLRTWLQAFTDLNYQPEPRKRRRPQSFIAPGERQGP